MDRFSAYLLLRRFLRRPSSRELALAIEGIMEELAGRFAPEQSTQWGVLGLLSQLDLEYATHNQKVRGATAREQAELEGLDPALSRSLQAFRGAGSATERPQVEDALCVAELLGRVALGLPEEASEPELEEPEPDEDQARPRTARREARFPQTLGDTLARSLELARGRGDPRGDRLDAALERLGLPPEEAARLALQGLQRIEADLR